MLAQPLHAHPGQAFPNSIPQIINNALRATSFAPSEREALDVVGEALCQLTEIVRAEACHA